MGQTKYFGLSFFDFGDQLDSSLSVQKEIDRFVVIDKQLYGLYSIMGNGVINGWTVENPKYSEEDGITVTIGTGLGIINYIASETSLPKTLYNLPSNSSLDIFAIASGSTGQTREVEFLVEESGTEISLGVQLARVTTGENSVLLIDNNVRDLVSFEQLIVDKINEHKHRGSPTKIDLQEEVKNQLPGASIEGIDASKITSGIFDTDRIPIIDHDDLDNNGLLTHAALDSFVQNLSQSNKELLGEISTTNLLKTIVYLKYLFPDVDEHFINELVLIPGISPDEFIDFNASTAHIDLDNQCISGYPAKTGIFTSVYWKDQQSLYNTYAKENVVISNGEISLDRSGSDIRAIEGFNNTTAPGNSVGGFTVDIIKKDEIKGVVSDGSDQNKIEGDYSGVFNASSSLQAIYTKDLRTDVENNIGEDWATKLYNQFVLWVKTTNATHKAVFLKFVTYDASATEGEQEKESDPFTLIAENHITTNTDSTKNGFEEIVIDLENIYIQNVIKIIIFTDDTDKDFSFTIDNIYVRRLNLVPEYGIAKYRYFTESDVVFHSIWFDSVVPTNTSVEVTVRTASSVELLSRSEPTLPMMSGTIFALAGTAIEITVTLKSTDYISTPVVDYLELRMLVDGDFTGFDISSATEWERGVLENISLEETLTTDSTLILSSPINVGGYFFAQKDSISEMNDENDGLLGFTGNSMPICPGVIETKKFDYLSSVIRKYDKNFLIADTRNNRILEVDRSGTLVKGFGSTYFIHEEFHPLSFVYNNVSHILTIVFTQAASVKDLTKIILHIGALPMALTSKEVVLTPQKADGKIVEIQLHENTWVALANVSNMTVSFDAGAFTESISDLEDTFIKLGSYGWDCFIGDFTYIENICHPIYFNILDNENLIVLNSSIFYDTVTGESSESDYGVPDIVEFNTETQDFDFTSDFVKFSDFTLGSIYEYEENKFYVAGIKEGESISGSLTGEDLLADNDNPTDKVKFRAAALDALNKYRGVVIIIDKNNNKFQVFYNSPDGLYPSDIDLFPNGNILIPESSFGDNSGRIVKIDSFANVNWVYGDGTFNIINDAKVVSTNHIMVSS